MEEIWNYAVDDDPKANKVFLAIWGSGVLEYDLATGPWQEYIDPDGEMEIDLYRDDGVNHVTVTGSPASTARLKRRTSSPRTPTTQRAF